MAMIEGLPVVERVKLHKLFTATPKSANNLEEYLTDKRFSDGRVCPICGSTHVHRNGRRANGSQKFMCCDCGKSFSIRTNTVFSGTHKGLDVWMEYLDCMAEGLSLAKTAERCHIAFGTAFAWRHKIMDAAAESAKDDMLHGIVEADETYTGISYKGNRKAFVDGTAGRSQRHHGGENHTAGLSDELVCVPCAVDRNGVAVSKVAKLGKCSTEAVEKVLGGHLDGKSTLCTDEDRSYKRFAKENVTKHVAIKGGRKTVKGIFHIQHLNAYHSTLKSFLSRFKGVSTKYLNNYLTWHNAVEHHKSSLQEKARLLLESLASAIFEETCAAVPLRPALPLLIKNQS